MISEHDAARAARALHKFAGLLGLSVWEVWDAIMGELSGEITVADAVEIEEAIGER